MLSVAKHLTPRPFATLRVTTLVCRSCAVRFSAWRHAFVLVGLSVVALAFLISVLPQPEVPTFQEVRARYRPSDVPLLDRSGEILHEVRVDDRGRRLPWTALSEISPALPAAVITSEDRRFYQHPGVDWQSLLAVGLRWLTGTPLRGASTVSMQVATLISRDLRQSKPGGTRNFASRLKRKWQQMRLAWALERRWSKAEILEAYLNLVPFRGEIEGVTAAAHVLFGKAPHGIGEAEGVVLAVLLRGPNAERERVTRRAWTLQQKQGGTTSQEQIAAAVEQVFHTSSGSGPRAVLAFHAAHRLFKGAQHFAPIHSSLDGQLQRAAAEILRQHLLAVRDQHVEDGAVLVVENTTGEVLAYVGGSGELSSAPYVDGVRARRQAGSTLKPFLYGLALEQRLLTPGSLLEDTPLELSVAGGLYRPQNYDEQFKGLVSVRTALAASLNVPAVRTLALVGAEAFVRQLQGLGFTGVVESGEYYGPALALGSADVTLWELVNAYRTLANGGVWSPLRMTTTKVKSQVSKVKSQDAEFENRPLPLGNPQLSVSQRLYSEETTFLLSHILSDRESRSVTFGLENPLATPFWSAVKTGTSKDMRDNWCVGYSQHYTVGVWVGNFSGAPMRDVSGVTGAAPIWMELMTRLHRTTPSAAPVPPAGVIAKQVRLTRASEPVRVEWFLKGTEPQSLTPELAHAQARILAPANGTMIALDPDIPPSRQRLVFEAHTAGSSLRWVLDGTDIGAASEPLMWNPQPGRHTLSLLDEGQQRIDSVAFAVRGEKGKEGSA